MTGIRSNYLLRGVLWTGLYLLLVLLPLLVLLTGNPPPGTAFGWDFAVALGFAALAIMFTMFLLTARFRWITHAYGIDIIYYFHRCIAVVACALLLAHPLILIGMEPLLVEYLKPDAPWHMVAGTVALAAVVLLMFTSLLRKQLRLHYDAWRFLHAVFAVTAVALATVHVAGINYYVDDPLKRGVWLALAAGTVLILLYVRLLRPLLQLRRHYEIVEVVPEHGDACTLTVVPAGHRGFRFLPGQFAWLDFRHPPWSMREHPFSIASSAEHPERLRFTIKRLGDFSTAIGFATPGQRIWLDGPFGAFSIDRYPDARGYVFIAGGIGIAPVLGMLRTLADRGDRRPLRLFYGYRNLERLTAHEELLALRARLDLELVIVLSEPPPGWGGATGHINRELLQRHLPEERAGLEFFMCGPLPMTHSIERTLHDMGIPLRRMHTELFDMA